MSVRRKQPGKPYDAVLQSGRLSPYRSTWTKPVAPAKSPRLWPPPAKPFVRIAPGSREPEIELRTSVARQKSAPRMFAGHTRRAFVSTAVSAADGQVMKLAHRGFLNSEQVTALLPIKLSCKSALLCSNATVVKLNPPERSPFRLLPARCRGMHFTRRPLRLGR